MVSNWPDAACNIACPQTETSSLVFMSKGKQQDEYEQQDVLHQS